MDICLYRIGSGDSGQNKASFHFEDPDNIVSSMFSKPTADVCFFLGFPDGTNGAVDSVDGYMTKVYGIVIDGRITILLENLESTFKFGVPYRGKIFYMHKHTS